MQYEGEDAGYVCWIRGKSDAQYDFTLTMLVPLETVGDDTRLRLSAPRATASEMRLTVPMAGAVGTVSDGTTPAKSAAGKKGTTEFDVVGLAPDFQLAWHRPDAPSADAPVALEAVGSVLRGLTAAGFRPRRRFRYGATAGRSMVYSPPAAGNGTAGKCRGGFQVQRLRCDEAALWCGRLACRLWCRRLACTCSRDGRTTTRGRDACTTKNRTVGRAAMAQEDDRPRRSPAELPPRLPPQQDRFLV